VMCAPSGVCYSSRMNPTKTFAQLVLDNRPDAAAQVAAQYAAHAAARARYSRRQAFTARLRVVRGS